MDSTSSDPRRLTAIVYLVPPDWDARPERDGGRLVWWLVDEDERPIGRKEVRDGGEGGGEADGGRSPWPEQKHQTDPQAGRLVLFKSRTVMHEVLPTHRKRFALTLWYFQGR